MTSLRVHQVAAVGTAAGTRLRVHRVASVSTGGTRLRVHGVVALGVPVNNLTASASSYDPQQLVVVTATVNVPGATWSVTGTAAPTPSVNGLVCSFTAPATAAGTTLTVTYGGVYLSVAITPAFVLVGPSSRPALVSVNVGAPALSGFGATPFGALPFGA